MNITGFDVCLYGEYYDKETGTIYLRARYYDPEIGRFVTEDSYWGEANDPLSLNYYLYCNGNAVNQIDPSGHLGDEYMLRMADDSPVYIVNKPNGPTDPASRIPILQLKGSGFCGEEFLLRLTYMQCRQGIDVKKLSRKELDAIYEEVHMEKVGMRMAALDAVGYGLAKVATLAGKSVATEVATKSQYAKTTLWERLTTNKLPIDKLVGNVKDEFMNPRIGPSSSALSKHMKYIAENGTIDGPILVKKLANGTYEIQNGHHRWLAAQKMGLKNVPVEVID
jgi:Predicted transcriptional regulators